MADVFVNRTTNFDGSGTPITATGPIVLSCTGNFGKARLTIFSQIESTDPQPIYESITPFTELVLLPAGADWYAVLEDISSNPPTELTLSYLAA